MPRPPNFPNLRKNIARRGALFLPLLIAACHAGGTNGSSIPGDRSDTRPYEGVAPGDTLRFTGTEPFWGGEVKGDRMIYKSPEQPDGETVTVARFNGRGGFSYSGTLGGAVFTMAITPGTCSDGMSDRSYPFVATLQRGQEMRTGCAWSDAHPFNGRQTP